MKIRLRYWRELKGLSQGKLAQISGIEKSYISHIERGVRQNIGADKIQALSFALGITPGELFEEEIPVNKNGVPLSPEDVVRTQIMNKLNEIDSMDMLKSIRDFVDYEHHKLVQKEIRENLPKIS